MNYAYNLCSTEQLLSLKKSIEFEIKNWERRIREQTVNYTPILRPVAEYRRRIKKCQKDLAVVDEELELRGASE